MLDIFFNIVLPLTYHLVWPDLNSLTEKVFVRDIEVICFKEEVTNVYFRFIVDAYPSGFNIFTVLTHQHLATVAFNIDATHNSTFKVFQL